VLALGLALTNPSPGQAKTFHCGAGDVQCLIDAIHEANTNGHKNTIRLAAGTYLLTAVDNDTDGPNGLPSITSVLTLQGAGADTTRLERVFTGLDPCGPLFSGREPAFRILHVAPRGMLILRGLTLRGGYIEVNTENVSGGGGLFNKGNVTLLDSELVENCTDTRFDFVGEREGGGGIANRGHLIVFRSTIRGNLAFGGGGVGILGVGIANHGTATVIASTIADHQLGDGAGIFSNGTLTVTHSRIADNFGGWGGGIMAFGHTVIDHSSIVHNTASVAGGIANSGIMHITESTMNFNFGTDKGGIGNWSVLTMNNSTIGMNRSEISSGGVANEGGTLTMLNSTIARNIADRPASFGVSAGVWNRTSGFPPIAGILTVQNTIVAQNIIREEPFGGGPDCGGPLTSHGHNLLGDPTDCTITLHASDRTGDPGLDALTDNGRPGHGHFPLLPTSSAIDAGNDAVCPRRDQLGQRRVNIPGVGTSRCDIGAVEFQHRDKHQDNADNDHPDVDNDQPDTDSAITAQATP
jgi:hypothetical protein